MVMIVDDEANPNQQALPHPAERLENPAPQAKPSVTIT